MSKRKMPKRQKIQPKRYTEKDLHDATRRGCESSAKFNLYLTMGSVLLALHEQYGFGKKRLDRLIDRVSEIEFNSLSVTELLDDVHKKTGIDLRTREAERYEPL